MDDYFDGDMLDDYGYGDLSEEDIMELMKDNEGQLTPEMLELLRNYHAAGMGKAPMDYTRIPVSELIENCVMPTCSQAFQTLIPLILMSLIFRLFCRFCLKVWDKSEGSSFKWLIHAASATFGFMVLNSFFRVTLVYLLLCAGLCYILFMFVCSRFRQWCGLAAAIFVVIFALSCELFLVESTVWHKIRGAQIILSMKIISLGMDLSKEVVKEFPGIMEYTGYCFNVGTVIFGPWISFTQYQKLLDQEFSPISFGWFLKVVTTISVSGVCLLISNCITHWIILDSVAKWILAYRDAQSFRFSHYFVSFMSDATASLSGITLGEGSQVQWNVVRPQHIEIPRSLVEVVTNWNLPMHYWLKTYVFKPVRPHGTFLAVILTYAASSMLHGLNFQLAAVLFSLGFYSYTEFVFRQRLSQVFDACIQAKRCKEKCDHKYTSRNPWVFLTNLAFGALAVFHLAYLGLMFDSSDDEDKGYTMWHTLDKWSSLDYMSHWVAGGTFILYWLI